MLFHPVYRILAAAFPLVAFCAASDTSDETNTYLWDMVPDCAKNCTKNFIASEYTSAECSDKSNIKCLCRSETSSNLTIGEGALSCVYALCTKEIKKSTNVYHICDSVSGALAETHATLTATTFAGVSTTTTKVTTTSSMTTIPTTESSKKSATFISTSSTSTSDEAALITSYHPSTSASEILPSTSSDTSTTAPTNSSIAATGKDDSHGVTSATVIGVSVASGVAGCFIIGAAVFFGVRKWRKKNQMDFEIGGDMSEPSNFSEPSYSRGPSPDLNPGSSELTAMRSPQEMSQLSQPPRAFQFTSYSPKSTAPGIRLVETPRDEQNQRIGYAITSESDWEGSPRTVDSQHTLAELLPIQTASLYPRPLRLWYRPPSSGTVFEEDDNHLMAEKSLPPLPSTRKNPKTRSPPVILGLPANPRAAKEGFPASKFRRVQTQQLSSTQSQTPREKPAGPRTLGPPFTATHSRRSMISNSSSGQNDSSGVSDHAFNTYLTTTPGTTAPGRILSGILEGNPHPPKPPSQSLAQAPDIVSRPRIVRAADIKRIPPGERPPSEILAPYCPEDFWLERGRGNAPSRSVSTELPYPSETFPGMVLYPNSPKKRPEDAPKRISPTSRNLTPSRRGEDLCLSVD
ncbi:hypothetical protein N7520_007986 [Penicillium odoratum]|uniref:uncharacterized protein n=1 Tax=Penicillium odoratum TaxID=1167516 RepID=UPI0025482780|nr:uncharacterized protein N7520_007986 [Penicillium odoratum]KAJ5760830.1 hypothetical protein N7520_007986 [Penicillium odoratum]